MAKSISQAQADALADNFFDTLGGNKDDFKPVKSLGVVVQMAGNLAERAANNLVKVDRVATGAGAASIKVLNPERSGNVVHVDVEMNDYLQFVDRGVRGVKRSLGAADFAFKTANPSKKMVAAIRKWVIREGLKARNPGARKYRSIISREARRKKISDTSTNTAYAIARGVKARGLRQTKFMTDAVRDTRKEIKESLGRSMKVDVINALPKKLNAE